jgi:peptide deformylase
MVPPAISTRQGALAVIFMFVMASRHILQLGHPLLRAASLPIPSVSDARAVLNDLTDTLHEFQRSHGFGRGISAVQIGHPLRLIYIEMDGRPFCLHNPEYQQLSDDRFGLWDDCFSFPDLMVWVERHRSLALRYQDESGTPCTLEASGALSELIQHEMDHLDGILAIDRAAAGRHSFCTREEWVRRYRATQSGPAASQE